jgi:predicted chitinase
MGKKYSLSVGLNAVDPKAYDGEWDGALACCEKDAKDITKVAVSLGYDKTDTLLTKNATRNNVLKKLSEYSKSLTAGDYLLLYYSGHGGQVTDTNKDEDDNSDETWCLYDGELIDDEIYAALSDFRPGLRIYVLSDSCHSGTVTKAAVRKSSKDYHSRRNLIKSMPVTVGIASETKRRKFYEKIQKDIAKRMKKDSAAEGAVLDVGEYQWAIKASVKLLSGCQDNQESGASPDPYHNSDFTDRLLITWNGGKFNSNYEKFHSRIISQMPSNQTPNVFVLGPEDPEFDRQAPFTNAEAPIYSTGTTVLKFDGVSLIKIGSKGKLVKAWQTFLNKNGYNVGTADGDFGNKTFRATIQFQNDNGLKGDGIAGPKTFEKAAKLGFRYPEEQVITPSAGGSKGISKEQLAFIMRGARSADIDTFVEPINKVMEKYEINTPLRIAHFLAQVGHESGSLRYKEEIASGASYEGRADLGNTQPGDGKKFKGHGLIQLTGRHNHTMYANYVGDPDLIRNPQRIAQEPLHSAGAAGWYWMTRKINPLADLDNIISVTKKINGGTNGLEDRRGYLARAKKVLGN